MGKNRDTAFSSAQFSEIKRGMCSAYAQQGGRAPLARGPWREDSAYVQEQTVDRSEAQSQRRARSAHIAMVPVGFALVWRRSTISDSCFAIAMKLESSVVLNLEDCWQSADSLVVAGLKGFSLGHFR